MRPDPAIRFSTSDRQTVIRRQNGITKFIPSCRCPWSRLFLIADAGAAPSLPASLNGFVHYSTSNYGGKISDKYVQKTSIQALQSGKTLPNGTAVVGIEYRDQNGKRGPVLRYIIMEKVRNGGKDYPASVRNGDWEFASFTPARALITNDPVTRCLACHKSQAQSDYLFGLNEMKSYKLK